MNRKLLKFLYAGIGTCAVAFVVAPSAQAQAPTTPVEDPIRIKTGTLLPLDDAGDNLFYLGGAYDFGKSSSVIPTVYSLDRDAGFKDKNSRLIGLDASFRYYFTPILVVTRF